MDMYKDSRPDLQVLLNFCLRREEFLASAQQLESSTTAAYPTYPTAYPTVYPYTWKAK